MREKLIKKTSCVCLAGALFAGMCFAGENAKVKEITDTKSYNALVSKGVYSEDRSDFSAGLSLVPESEYKELICSTLIKKTNKNFPYTNESIYLLHKKDLLATSNSDKTDITIDDVSKVVRSISKMQGMKYYSTTRKKEYVLYEKTYMIAGANDKTRVEDQNKGNADGQISYCLQDDSSFGINTYKLTYRQNEDSLWCNFTILDKMGIGPFKAIYPGKMVINILLIDCDEDILMYLNTDVDSVKYPGIKGQIVESMTSRMNAVYKWFITQF